ncbi:MAG: hypothetical protein ABIN67_23870 [Ferruginibacter sp.]
MISLKLPGTISLLLLFALALQTQGQDNKNEKFYPLSKQARKGYIEEVTNRDNKIQAVYKIKGDTKDALAYEVYEFDNDLNLVRTAPEKVKVDPVKTNFTKTLLHAYVGGGNSFNVLSMDLKFYKLEKQFTWNLDKKKYDIKYLSNKEVKLKSENGKNYVGYTDYYNSESNTALVLARVAEKGSDNEFMLLNVSFDLDIKPTSIKFDYPVSLVYSCSLPALSDSEVDEKVMDNKELLKDDNVLFIFAPDAKKGIATNKYTLVIADREGKILSRNDFEAPSGNMAVIEAVQKGSDLFLCAGSSKDADNLFSDEYGEFANIANSGGGENRKALSYFKKAKDFKFFHLLKVTEGKLVWSTTTAIKDFKAKLRIPPGQKSKVSSYEGDHFTVAASYIAPNGDIFISGQKRDMEMVGSSSIEWMYQDIICFQFDKDGNIKSQFGIDNINDDKKSTIFQIGQLFIASPQDKNNVYLQLLEVKGVKGYADFGDALAGNKTTYRKTFPRIVKINTTTAEITGLTILGLKKYYFHRSNGVQVVNRLGKDGYLIYVGEDLDGEEIWLGKYKFE